MSKQTKWLFWYGESRRGDSRIAREWKGFLQRFKSLCLSGRRGDDYQNDLNGCFGMRKAVGAIHESPVSGKDFCKGLNLYAFRDAVTSSPTREILFLCLSIPLFGYPSPRRTPPLRLQACAAAIGAEILFRFWRAIRESPLQRRGSSSPTARA